jgi:hypothetical protein
VQRDEDDGTRRARGEPIDGLTHPNGPVRPERLGVVVGRRRPAVASMAGRQPPPAALEVDEHLPDREADPSQRVGDRRTADDRDIVLG